MQPNEPLKPSEGEREYSLTPATYTLIFESLGQASMCWSVTPKGEFESTEARKIGENLANEILKDYSTLKKQIEELDEAYNTYFRLYEDLHKEHYVLKSNILELEEENRRLESDLHYTRANLDIATQMIEELEKENKEFAEWCSTRKWRFLWAKRVWVNESNLENEFTYSELLEIFRSVKEGKD